MKNHQFLAFGVWALALALVPSVAQRLRNGAPSIHESAPKNLC